LKGRTSREVSGKCKELRYGVFSCCCIHTTKLRLGALGVTWTMFYVMYYFMRVKIVK